MTEIKVKNVVFVSVRNEDNDHKPKKFLIAETYQKWKCATPGESTFAILLQFEKPMKIHSIDIGNENSAFVAVFVGKSPNSVSDFQVLLENSSFMSPFESINSTHTDRVRTFGPEKLSQTTKDKEWNCAQVVCTQPFNKHVTYGLSFIKFHSTPDEKFDEKSCTAGEEKCNSELGAVEIKKEQTDFDDTVPSITSWENKELTLPTTKVLESSSGATVHQSPYSLSKVALDVNSSVSNVSFQCNSELGVVHIKKEKDDMLLISSWRNEEFTFQGTKVSESSSAATVVQESPSYAADIPASSSNASIVSSQDNSLKRKVGEINDVSKKSPDNNVLLNEETNVHKDVLQDTSESKRMFDANANVKKEVPSPKKLKKEPETLAVSRIQNTIVIPGPSRPKVPFRKILDKVVISLSGFLNPLRSELRCKALEMGAKYKPGWEASCTHLVCAFNNTPKYRQAKFSDCRIVTKEWILDCHRRKECLPWRKYKLSTDSSDENDDSDSDTNNSDEESTGIKIEEKKINSPTQFQRIQQANIPSTMNPQSSNFTNQTIYSSSNDSLSNTVTMKTHRVTKKQHEALLLKQVLSYISDSDSEDNAGGDTESESHKVETKAQKEAIMNDLNKDVKVFGKLPDPPLSKLPNIFQQMRFFLCRDFSSSKLQELAQHIIAYSGVVENCMSDKIKYVITEKKWDSSFDDALSRNADLIFVKPMWIYKCHEAGKFVPYQLYIVVPGA